MTLSDGAVWRQFRHHSRTFSLATRLLPREVRLPIATLYLFCRTVDTLADERIHEVGAEAALRELDELEDALRQTLDGTPPAAPLWQRLGTVHRRYGLDARPFFQLVEGARWDLTGRETRTEADLLHYSDLVGGCVGAMVLPFLVPDRARAADLERAARDLGVAMQITNILRDVGEDRRDLGRLYLPIDALEKHGLLPASLAPTPAYAALVESLMELAETRYTRGLAAIAALPRSVRRGITAAARMYREILNEVRAHGYDNLTRRAIVPFRRKVTLVLRDDYDRRKRRLVRLPAGHAPIPA